MHLFRLCLPAIITSKVIIFLFCQSSNISLAFNETVNSYVADIDMEEGELDLLILPVEKAHPSILFIHIVLHYTSVDYVCARSRITRLGDMLHSCLHVVSQHSSGDEVLPLHCALPSLRKHNVSDKVQCHGFRSIQARKFIRMDCNQESG